jgi:hypothetical protein
MELQKIYLFSLIVINSDQPRGLVVRVPDCRICGSGVRFPVLPWGFFLEGEDSHGDGSLGGLVELRFKAPPAISYSYTYITIYLIGAT